MQRENEMERENAIELGLESADSSQDSDSGVLESTRRATSRLESAVDFVFTFRQNRSRRGDITEPWIVLLMLRGTTLFTVIER